MDSITHMNEKDDFRDILKLSELALKEVWNNMEDNIWKYHLVQ
jgi:hypothetical protein